MKLRTLNDIMKPFSPETLAEWEEKKAELLDTLKFASGIELLRHDAPLNAQVFDAFELDAGEGCGCVVEKVIFQSLPGYYVTGNLYRPKDVSGSKRYPAVLNPHGHWQNGRRETDTLARIPQRCANLAMRGMVAFIYDMVGCNDSRQVPHNGADPEWEKWNWGRFALQLNNSVKAVDFVSSLPYVDAERIGCTGCSGGGTQTYFLTAYDPRIKAAAPINMASTRMQGGCICENPPFLRTEACNIDYTMTIAPRPLFMSGSDGDWTVTSQTVEFPAVEKVYRLYGAEENFEHFYQSAPHCYNLPIRERVYRFFCRHFGIDDPFASVGEIDFDLDTDKLLIGDLRSRVPAEGYIENDEMLFEKAKEIIRSNLAAIGEAEKAKTARRVFLLDRSFPLDLPYIVEKEDAETPVVTLGACPSPGDGLGVKYPHTYNFAEDAKRVSALVTLFRAYPNALFRAEGKTAALCELALRFSPETKTELSSPDGSGIFIPGSELV